MAVVYNVAVKTVRMEAVRTYFNNGTLEILTAADALLVTFGLTSPAGAAAASGVWNLMAFDSNTVAATGTGTAAKAQIKNSGGLAHITGLTVTATGGGGDLILDSLSITAAQNVTLSTATITHAA